MEEQKDPTILEKIREMLAGGGAPISTDVNTMSKADQVDANMADGGAVMDPKDVIGLPGVPDPNAKPMPPMVAAGLPGVPALPGVPPKAPSDEEKMALIMEAMKEGKLKMADGGMVDPSELPMPADAPQESKLQAIMKAIGMAGSNLANSPAGKVAGAFVDPMGAIADVAKSPMAQNIVKSEAQTAVPAIRALGGIPASPTPPSMPQSPAQPPVDQGFMDKLNAGTAMTPPSASAPVHATHAPAPDPLAQLGQFDPSTVAPGFNPNDRQTLAHNLDQNQHTFGNYLAQAMAGIGDAVAAKGGVQQDSLGKIFALQTQQRHEALENFDKARQIAVDHFSMKNQADQALISNLKARNELIMSPQVAQMIGHPELAGKPVNHAELVLKTDAMKQDYRSKMMERKQSALKTAAEESDKAIAHGGIAGTQKMMDPESRLNFIHTHAVMSDPEAFGWEGQALPTGKK